MVFFSPLVAVSLLASTPGTPADAPPAASTAPASPAPHTPLPPPQPLPPSQPTAATTASDDIVVSGSRRPPREDPAQAINLQSYAVTQALDTAIVAPAAMGYKRALPEPVRAGVRNFFNHLTLPVVFLNDLLQLKPGRAAKTLARFAINTTVGVAGLVDVAKRKGIGLPLRRNGFANTLGYYGIKTGPFLFLPLVGPTTVRDLIGLIVDRALLPTVVGKPFNQPAYAIAASLVGSIDYRAEYDEQLRNIRAEVNPYAAARANYLRGRQAEIDALHSRPARPISAPAHSPNSSCASVTSARCPSTSP